MVGGILVGLGDYQLLLIESFFTRHVQGNSSSSSLNLSCTQSLLQDQTSTVQRTVYSGTHASISVVSALLFHYSATEEED